VCRVNSVSTSYLGAFLGVDGLEEMALDAGNVLIGWREWALSLFGLSFWVLSRWLMGHPQRTELNGSLGIYSTQGDRCWFIFYLSNNMFLLKLSGLQADKKGDSLIYLYDYQSHDILWKTDRKL
jgi:hypothetical protein